MWGGGVRRTAGRPPHRPDPPGGGGVGLPSGGGRSGGGDGENGNRRTICVGGLPRDTPRVQAVTLVRGAILRSLQQKATESGATVPDDFGRVSAIMPPLAKFRAGPKHRKSIGKHWKSIGTTYE